MKIERTTPFGIWRYGNDFRRAALAVLQRHNERHFMPYYFLLGLSIELSLKAFLMGRGIPLRELAKRNKYGHDLRALLVEARRRKLGREAQLSPAHCGAIHLLCIEYLAGRFRYIEAGGMVLPDARLAHESADILSEGLEYYCRRITYPERKPKPYRLRPTSIGKSASGYDLDKALQLSDEITDNEFARETKIQGESD